MFQVVATACRRRHALNAAKDVLYSPCIAMLNPGNVGTSTADQSRFSSGSSAGSIFDPSVKAAQRSRAARYTLEPDPLQDEVAERVVERVDDCSRQFTDALIVGGAGIQVLKSLLSSRSGNTLKRIVVADHSIDMLDRSRREWEEMVDDHHEKNELLEVGFHEMDPTAANESIGLDSEKDQQSFDLVISCLGLHWVNDIPVCCCIDMLIFL
jgi:NADH dehydrogenase [ubiquinone] 1 alpha subcomplex assembly factor 5